MADIGRREGRSAFRRLIQDLVPPEHQTRVHQLFESVVFSVEPILRGLEYFEVRYGSGAPTISDYPDDGFGIFIDEGAGSAWAVLKWQNSFYIIGGSGAGSLPAHTHDHLTEITNVGANTHTQIDGHIVTVDAHIADGTIHFTAASLFPILAQTTPALTLGSGHWTVLCDGTSNTVTITLPDPSTQDGKVYNIKAINIDNAVSIDPDGADIDADPAVMVLALMESVTLQSDGSNWWII